MEFTASVTEPADAPTMKFFLILSAVLVTVSGYPRFGKEGDTCKTPEGKGVCLRIKNCPKAIEDVKNGRIPQKCAFFQKSIIVCCVKTRVSQEYCQKFRKLYYPGLGSRINQGTQAKEEELPHMAAIGYFKKGNEEGFTLLCTGTLISEQFVVTAAHCLVYMFPPEVVYLGHSIANLDNNVQGFIDIDRENMIKHPLYNRSYHDIALLKLTMKVYLNELMAPACLYTMEDDPVGPLYVAGWGSTSTLGVMYSTEVFIGSIQTYGAAQCEKSYKSKFRSGINSSLICAGDPLGNIDTCQGDSGGPLMIKDQTGYYTLLGITSIGKTPCGAISSIYIRISSYIDWIEHIVWSNN